MLRRGKIDASLLRAWDQELFRAADVVDRCRAQYTDKLITQYRELAGHLSDVPIVDIRYKRGWSDDLSLEDAMTEGLDRDLRTGITNVGPHRADLHISVDGVQAAERLSRGQEKTLICTLKLAQVALLLKETGKRCLFLIDDFAAELDIHNRERLVQLLQVLDSQVFITGITREDLANSWSEQSDLRVFHVEHGEITSQSDSEQGMTLDV
jgi:DNA replication and repair protein RecF